MVGTMAECLTARRDLLNPGVPPMRRLVLILAGLLLASRAASAVPPDTTVADYHGDPAHSGHLVVPGLTWARAAAAKPDTAFDGTVQGHVNAQPLYWHKPGAAHGLVIVATDSDTVYALDSRTGRPVWQRALGPAATRSEVGCGNINPIGVTGTPVIDPARDALYLDAMVDQHGTAQHLVFGLSLADGAVLPGWPVNVADGLRKMGQEFSPRVQEQRGALALLDGRVYVPFGGYWGDCGPYHGWVVGLDPAHPGIAAAWDTRGTKGGIWATGGIVSDGRSLIFATGNTAGTRDWSDGEAVFRLAPDLRRTTDPDRFFAPANWRELDDEDADLGGTAPTLIDLPGGTPSHLVLALGKDGNAYLLDRDHLGGIGQALATFAASNAAIITATATYPAPGGAFVAFQGHGASCPGGSGGLVALRIAAGPKPALSRAWCAPLDGRGAPIVTTSDATADPVVWVAGAEGDERLHAFRGDTGAPLFTSERLQGLRHFVTPLAADGRVFVAGDGRVHAFDAGLR